MTQASPRSNHEDNVSNPAEPITTPPSDLATRPWTFGGEDDAHDRRRHLATLPIIEQSKGILMAYYSIDSTAAFAVLQRWSQHTNTKITTLSTALIDATQHPDAERFEELRRLLTEFPPEPHRID